MLNTFLDDPLVSAALGAIDAVAAGARPDDLESVTLDFKEEGGRRDPAGVVGPSIPENKTAAKALAEEASCLANSEGGVLVVGVDDKGHGTNALLGTDLKDEWLRERIWAYTEPSLAVEVQPVERHGARLLLVRVPKSYRLHRCGKEYKHRINDSCVTMSIEEQRRSEEARTGYDWSAERSDRAATDVSASALDLARRYLRDTGDPDRAALAGRSDLDLLRALGVIDTATGMLTNAGAVLFCDSDVVLVDYQRRPAPGASSTDRWEGKAPLLSTFAEVKTRIDAVNDVRELQLPSGVRPRMRLVPDRAVREALVNALMHRDYRSHDAVVVEMVGRQLLVSSPGGFPHGITVKNIISERSHPRNASLAAAFRSLRLAEQEGVGVDRMFRDMAGAGLALPTFADTGGRVRCVLVGGDPVPEVVELLSALPPEAQDDVDIALILHVLLERANVTAKDLVHVLQKLPVEAEDALNRGLALGLLQLTANSRRSNLQYRLSDASRAALASRLPYMTHSSEEAEEFVVRHVLRAGTIRAGDVVDMLGVLPNRASIVLRELREAGVLVFGGTATRGRGVFHVPGPAFGDAVARHGLS